MNPWPFVLGAYAVTVVVVILEVIAVARRNRAAREVASADGATAHPRDLRS
jgi:hypothetical protein